MFSFFILLLSPLLLVSGDAGVCSIAMVPCGVCRCCFQTSVFVECEGAEVTDIPSDLPRNVSKLVFHSTAIRSLSPQVVHLADSNMDTKTVSKLYNFTELRFLEFNSNDHLAHIDPGAFEFSGTDKTISYSPLLSVIKPGVLGSFNRLRSLTISSCHLEHLPFLGDLYSNLPNIDILDFSYNRITEVPDNGFGNLQVAIGSMKLQYNAITTVGKDLFVSVTGKSAAEVTSLYLNNNPSLVHVNDKAFVNCKLGVLDLSTTSITKLPTQGLSRLETLLLEDTWTLTTFPAVLDLIHIKEAALTYPHHCCAFKHPELQYPERFLEFKKELQETCSKEENGDVKLRRKRSDGLSEDIAGFGVTYNGSVTSILHETGLFDDYTLTNVTNVSNTKPMFACGNVTLHMKNIKCSPQPDELNPCEDVMGFMWLRIFVWFVVVTALFGNLIVLVVTVGTWSVSKFTVAKFLMCNLAFADLLISIYLLMLASFDLQTMGVYFTKAIPWQYGGWCQAAGFLAIFATCLSTFTLTVITMERWYAIRYAIHLTKRLRLKRASEIVLLGWSFALFMAFLPILGVSSYSKTSVCLPMQVSTAADHVYVAVLLAINALAFCLICFCYADMFRQVRGDSSDTNTASHNDMTIAKKMSILVFTDFLCLFPIAFFGLTAVAGSPYIDVSNSKILLVFFFPLNSCANPFLYAIVTKQFKKDLFALLKKCSWRRRKTKKYRTSNSSNPPSWSLHSRSAQARNLIHRPSASSAMGTLLSKGSTSSTTPSPKVNQQSSPPNFRRSPPRIARQFSNGYKCDDPQCLAPVERPPVRRLSVVHEQGSYTSNSNESSYETSDNQKPDLRGRSISQTDDDPWVRGSYKPPFRRRGDSGFEDEDSMHSVFMTSPEILAPSSSKVRANFSNHQNKKPHYNYSPIPQCPNNLSSSRL